jgi:hypothetical protein
MMMVIFQFTKLILDARTIIDFKDHAHGFEEVKRSIDRGQSNLLLLFEKVLVEFLGAQRSSGIEEFLINQKSRMASPEFSILEYAF